MSLFNQKFQSNVLSRAIQRFVVFTLFAISSVSSQAEQPGTVTLFAASSLTVVLPEIISTFEEQSGLKVNVVYAGSGQLARQIQFGAPADIFISANSNWSEAILNDQRISAQSFGSFASNHLVVVHSNRTGPSPSTFEPDNLTWWTQALDGQRLAIGEPSSVPVGMYAQESLVWYDVWRGLQHQLAPAKSTRSALALVERGQTPLGIVYESDASHSDSVTIIGQIDAQSHQSVEYPMVYLEHNKSVKGGNEAPRKLLQFLLSDSVKQQVALSGFSS